MKMKLIRWLRRHRLWPQMKRNRNLMRRWVVETMHDERGVLPDLVAVTLNDHVKKHMHAALLRPPLSADKRAMVRNAFSMTEKATVHSPSGEFRMAPVVNQEAPRPTFEVKQGFGSNKVH